MNVVDTIYSLAVVKDLSDDELYQRLFESWNITNGKIEVWGELKAHPRNGFIKLKNIKTISENREISYPLNVMHNIESGIYILQEYAKKITQEQSSNWIKCRLELSPLEERIKRNNPFELSVKTESVQRLISMPIAKDDIIESGDSSYLSKKVYDFNLALVSEKINENKIVLEMQLQEQQREMEAELQKKHNTMKNNQQALEKELQESVDLLSNKLEKSEVEYSQISDDLAILTEKNFVLERSNSKLEQNINTQEKALIELSHEYEKVEEEMSQKVEKLKSYINDKASFLKTFEFIDEEDFNKFIFNINNEEKTSGGISFQDVFDGNYSKAVSYIQVFNFEIRNHLLSPIIYNAIIRFCVTNNILQSSNTRKLIRY